MMRRVDYHHHLFLEHLHNSYHHGYEPYQVPAYQMVVGSTTGRGQNLRLEDEYIGGDQRGLPLLYPIAETFKTEFDSEPCDVYNNALEVKYK
jgi:hypothetical protein